MGEEPIDPVSSPGTAEPGGMGANEKTRDVIRVIAAPSESDAIDFAAKDGLVSVARAIMKAVNLEGESARPALDRISAARSLLAIDMASAIDSPDEELTA